MAGLARRLANTVGKWKDIHALMANWMDLLLCSGIVIFCDLVHTVHVYVMLWLDWLVV